MFPISKRSYWVHQDVVDCTLYGLPQNRRRMVLLASLLGPIELIGPTRRKPKTVRDAIGRLPAIRQGTAHPKDPLHSASTLSDLNLKRIRASRPGGTWRDWPKHLVAECHKRETGYTYPGVYGRMAWDEPAPTLTTQFFGFGNGRFGHPEQDRAISLREGAILQGFCQQLCLEVQLLGVVERLFGAAHKDAQERAINLRKCPSHLRISLGCCIPCVMFGFARDADASRCVARR